MTATFNSLNMTPEEARAFIRKVMGPPRRVLEGQERDNVWLMIQLQDEPNEFSNNQHSISEVYRFNQQEYHVHYFPNEDPIIEEIMSDD
jgi:hypothetical protein